ncbi:hypothetical protein [truncated ORF], partial [Aspergillus niger]|uniref:Uncharacterized protein n=2 Tax=Aspergillus niger TaxID=5061 RepID=A0AAJ8BNM8_ASPNG
MNKVGDEKSLETKELRWDYNTIITADTCKSLRCYIFTILESRDGSISIFIFILTLCLYFKTVSLINSHTHKD